MNYYRITGYAPEQDFCFIVDCNGMFDAIWKFSSMLVQKKLKIIEVTDSDKFLDVNFGKVAESKERIYLRASAKGKPEYIEQSMNGNTYKAIKVADKIYIPNK